MNNDFLTSAREFALKAHGDQTYGVGVPYSVHLDNVVGVLLNHGVTDESVLAAGYLHDTLEDTNAIPYEIELYFGEKTFELVSAVTNEEGKNRKERHLKTYPKIKACPGATQLKLADRIANVAYSLHTVSPLFYMYQKEYADFKQALYVEGDCVSMWQDLDVLNR